MALPAETVGRFVLHSRMRRRGVGEVWTALDRTTRSRVVLRLLDTRHQAACERLVRLSGRLAELSHPALLPILECGVDGDRVWWVMVDGGDCTLADLCDSGGLPPLDRALAMLASSFEAVSLARRHGVSALLFTPEHLWSSGGGAHCRVAGPPVSRADLVQLWASPDTDVLPYMAPEVLDGAEPDARSDVFTAGVVIYEVLAGGRPFEARSAADLITLITQETPPALPALPGAAEALLQEIIDRALAMSPVSRFADLEALAASLSDASLLAVLRSNRPVEPSLPGSRATSSHRAPPIVVGEPSTTLPAVDNALPVYDENVQFTVYRPQSVKPGVWQTMLVFAHLDALPDDASPGELSPAEEVQRQAVALLGDSAAHGAQTIDSSQPVPREGWLTVSVSADGVQFNPPSRSFRWSEPVHREEFRLRAGAHLAGQIVRGRMTVFLGSIILADLTLKLRVASVATGEESYVERQSVRPYRHIFASYSHSDAPVVDEFSRYARAVGDRYLRDVIDLRSGECWSRGLEELISKADVFQLFWSWNALRSTFVRQEWQYALSLQRPAFIRPVYWDLPLPEHGDLPPPALRSLHFERITPVAVVGRRHGAEAPPAAVVAGDSSTETHDTPPVDSRPRHGGRWSWSAPWAAIVRNGWANGIAVVVVTVLLGTYLLDERPAAPRDWGTGAAAAIGEDTPAPMTDVRPTPSIKDDQINISFNEERSLSNVIAVLEREMNVTITISAECPPELGQTMVTPGAHSGWTTRHFLEALQGRLRDGSIKYTVVERERSYELVC